MARHAVPLRTPSVCFLALTVLALSGCALSASVAVPDRAPAQATGSTGATGMTKLAFPSEEFPAQPGTKLAVTLQIPQDWRPVHPTGVVLAARRVAEEGAFVPNVVVRIESRPAGFEVTDALSELKAFAASKPQGTTSQPYQAEIDGRQFVGCDVSWVDDRAGTVLQAHLFSAVPSGPSLQLVQVTGSVGGAQARTDYPTIKAIVKSLTVGT